MIAESIIHLEFVSRCDPVGSEESQRQNNILWIPNNGKMPPNVDLAKLFAARALAAYEG